MRNVPPVAANPLKDCAMRIFTFACWILFAGWMSSPGLAADPPRSRLQVINGSDQPIDVFWIESEEKRVASGSVAPGAETFITTTLKHRFAFVSQTDKSESFVTSDVPIHKDSPVEGECPS